MSIASEIERISGKVNDSFDAVEGMGGTVTSRKVADLPDAINTIIGEPEKRFDKSIANFIGELDANGALQQPLPVGNIVFSGVKELGISALSSAFTQNTGITSVSFPNLLKINGDYAAYNAFHTCLALSEIDIKSLVSIHGSHAADSTFVCFGGTSPVDISSLVTITGEHAAESMFKNATDVPSVDVSALTSINGISATDSMFSTCTNITSVDISSLTTVSGTSALSKMFYYCSKLESIRFPMLQLCTANSWTTDIFKGTTDLTDIHFRMDMASVVPTWNGYSTQWGAPNATIYFDLVGHIIVNGITYSRFEGDSIRSNNQKQYVAWIDANITDNDDIVYTRDTQKDRVTNDGVMLWSWSVGSTTICTTDKHPTMDSKLYDVYGTEKKSKRLVNIYYENVYTPFNSTTEAEPVVGNTVYSDAGQTAVGTITEIS